MKILVNATHYPVCSARMAVNALRALGHEVCHWGPTAPGGPRRIWGLTLAGKHIWHPRPAPAGWEPDLAILMDTAYHWHHQRAPTVVWTVDNHARNVEQPDIAHYFMAHLRPTYLRPSMTPWGDRAMYSWLPCAADLDLCSLSPVPFHEREYDVCCLGVMYPERRATVHELRRRGLKVLAGTGLVGTDYRDAHHNSRMALVYSQKGDLPIRLFEAVAMGVVPLCGYMPDYDHDRWERDMSDNPQKCRMYSNVLWPALGGIVMLPPLDLPEQTMQLVDMAMRLLELAPPDIKKLEGGLPPDKRALLGWQHRAGILLERVQELGIIQQDPQHDGFRC